MQAGVGNFCFHFVCINNPHAIFPLTFSIIPDTTCHNMHPIWVHHSYSTPEIFSLAGCNAFGIITNLWENVFLVDIMFCCKYEVICIIQTEFSSNFCIFQFALYIGKSYLPMTKQLDIFTSIEHKVIRSCSYI